MEPIPGTSREAISSSDPATQGSSESDFLSPKKKRPRGSAFSANEKLIIVNVYKHILQNWPQTKEWSATNCAQQTADMTGVSLASIYNIIKEYKTAIEVKNPKQIAKRLSFQDKLDDFTLSAIRRKVHQFFFDNEIPTIEKIHAAIAADEDMPSMSKSTVRNIMHHLNFKYTSRKRRNSLNDKREIILWRQRYLNKIKEYRQEGTFIYYQDETWVNEGHTVSKVWQDTSIKSARDAFLQGLSTGLKAPSGKGRRLIISHIGSEEGFLDDGLLVFESKKGLADYHKEMNSEVFETWFKGILPKLKDGSVVVLDNAPYHSRQLERIPTTNWKKAAIQEWLVSKNLSYDEGMLKENLLDIVRVHAHKYKKMVIDELAAERGITVLRLPPYHCELNPIELIWAQVKGYVARNNKTFKLAEVKNLLTQAINNVTPEKWQECIRHTITVEDKMCTLDHVIDTVRDRFIINVSDEDDDDDQEFMMQTFDPNDNDYESE